MSVRLLIKLFFEFSRILAAFTLKETKFKSMYEELAFNLALETLGMRLFVFESDHPMLCEGIRRKRGELSRKMLLCNRDSVEKLGKILEKLLDVNVHRMYL